MSTPRTATFIPRTPKGMRDFLPAEKLVRDRALSTMVGVFNSYGFDPLETSPVELSETLAGKIGAEEKLIFGVTSRGDTALALRYDLTVPLARVMAQYPRLPKPFRRYQIGSVYRGENTQRGRYRQFLQVDIDTVGSTSILADAEIIAAAAQTYQSLGLRDFKILINSRPFLFETFKSVNIEEGQYRFVSTAIDKLAKSGEETVRAELAAKGLSDSTVACLFETLRTATTFSGLEELRENLAAMGVPDVLTFTPFLTRGLDYYTGAIFECVVPTYDGGSIGAGGRYDDLIGSFARTSLPAVGFSFGFDRTLEALAAQGVSASGLPAAQVLVTVFDTTLENVRNSARLAAAFRKVVSTELYVGNGRLEAQLKYADTRGIPFVVIAGPTELASGNVTLKDLTLRTQRTLSLTEAVDELLLSKSTAAPSSTTPFNA